MSYDQSDTKFNELLHAVLSDPNNSTILKEARSVELELDDIRKRVQEKKGQVWDSASSVVKESETADSVLKTKKANAEALVKRGGSYGAQRRWLRIGWIIWGVYLAWGTLAVFLREYKLVQSPGEVFGFEWGGVAGTVVFFILANLQEALDKKINTWAAGEAGISSGTESLIRAQSQIDKVLVQAILKEISEFIGDRRRKEYGKTVHTLIARGLEEMAGSTTFEIPRDVRARVSDTMHAMQAGTIGIAGPRGIGKTTLLRSLSAIGSWDDKKPPERLSIFTSAPVEYNTRDFVLHLLTRLCEGVLVDHHAQYVTSPSAVVGEARDGLVRQQMQGSFAVVASLGGLVLIAVGLNIAPVPSADAINRVQLITFGGILLGLAIFAFLDRTGWIGRMKARIGMLLTRHGNNVRNRMLQTFPRISNRFRMQGHRSLRPDWTESKERIELVRTAQRLLDDAKYQLSYSSGWTGALKTPAVASGLSSAVTLARTQLSLPELVKQYREFLEVLTRDPPSASTQVRLYKEVVIVIDELDKLESDEAAHRFINEIKAIFGIPGCFYLISISETAMSGFERRGIHFRDAFDSALDDVVLVDYFAQNEARRVVIRRIVGLPESFICFLHAISGGLPRDLIRECRSLIIERGNESATDLPNVVQRMMKRDVRKKLFAVRIAATTIEPGPETGQLLEKLHHLEPLYKPNEPIRARELLQFCVDLFEKLGEVRVPLDARAVSSQQESVGRLMYELAAYLYFSSTILEYFSDPFDPARLQALDDRGDIEKLARARQALGVHPRIACAILTDVRTMPI